MKIFLASTSHSERSAPGIGFTEPYHFGIHTAIPECRY